MKSLFTFVLLLTGAAFSFGQVDTTLIYNTGMPYGTLDIRIAKSADRYYYLETEKTFSFRQVAGSRTNTFLDCTDWDSSPYTEGNLREKNNSTSTFIMNYRLLKPMEDDADGKQPLLLVLHDLPGRSNCLNEQCYWADRNWRPSANSPTAPTTSDLRLLNNDDQLQVDGQFHLQSRTSGSDSSNNYFPGFILFPQSLNSWNPDPLQDVIRMIRLLVKLYDIDENRIYIQGFGEGGTAAYEVIKRSPWLFAGGTIISATHDAGASSGLNLPFIAPIPLRIYQGSLDASPTPAKTESFINLFRQGGMNVNYKIFHGAGHDIRLNVLNEPDYYSWFLNRSRNQIHVPKQIRVICKPTPEPLMLSLSRGFHAYQWRKDGAVLSGESAFQLAVSSAGEYTARLSRIINPSEENWTPWSAPVNISETNPGAPGITQFGTHLLPDLNNLSTVTLVSNNEAEHYFWYKDDVLIDLPGNADDTTRSLIVKSAMGSGIYTLRVQHHDLCTSPPAGGRNIFFNNASSIAIPTPSKFKAKVLSHTTIDLSWIDQSMNETGFEIWRREQIGSEVFSSWVLATTVGTDTINYVDKLLKPQTRYHYKIRAVNDGARSYYVPSHGYQLEVTTDPPPAPAAPFQVDTTFVYNPNTPFGLLDIRIAKSSVRYYYLKENQTVSYRESTPGIRTNTYFDMTSWDSSPYLQGNLREINGVEDNFVMNYRLLFPSNYLESYPNGYPIIVMTHGAGERGNCWNENCHWAARSWRYDSDSPAAPRSADHPLLNNDHNLLHGGEIHLRARNLAGQNLPDSPTLDPRAFPGFVLFPQNLNAWNADPAQEVIRIVRLLTKKYNIDQNRIYIHGLSDGGTAVYEIVKRAPWLFTAAAPMSAITDADINMAGVTRNVSGIPFWIFQGGVDGSPTPYQTEQYVNAFRKSGMEVRYTLYPTLGHGVWNNAYSEPDFFRWLLEKDKSSLHVFAQDTAICRTNNEGVLLSLAEGFLAYQWEKNGIVIPGANTYSFTALDTGTYRARFSRSSMRPSESEWNNWSGAVRVTEQYPEKAKIVQHGTILLRDLNDNGAAHLEAKGTHAHYYWYKDSVLLDLPGALDDTTKHVFLPGATGNGIITLVTSGYDNCPSPASDGKYVFFNNQAPVNIDAPTKFTGTPTDSTIALKWQDASLNETAFELWRRELLPSGLLSAWQLVSLMEANATTFTDTGVAPSTAYHYKVRAISTSGRSYYNPTSGSQLIVTTLADHQAPQAVKEISITFPAFRQFKVSWIESHDNTGISDYVVYFMHDNIIDSVFTEGTFILLAELPINKQYELWINCIDLAGNRSLPGDTVAFSTNMSGLYYEHSTGAWTDLDAIDWTQGEFKGHVNNVTLAPRTQEDYFNFEFDGYFYLSNGGLYEFRISSDDGSRLTLNDTLLIDNDGLHGHVTVASAPVFFDPGPVKINVKFFEYGGAQTLIVEYRGPDSNNVWARIPDHAMTSGPVGEILPGAHAASSLKMASLSIADVYPNPISGQQKFSVAIESDCEDEATIDLFDATGQRNIISKSIALHEGMNKIDIEDIRPGFYVLTINTRKGTEKQKLLVK